MQKIPQLIKAKMYGGKYTKLQRYAQNLYLVLSKLNIVIVNV